jgi:competence protein ComFC
MRGQGDEVPWDGVGSGWKQWLEGALGLFYPPVCQVCRQEAALARDGYVGAECRREVRWIQPPFCDRCGLPFEGAITTEFKCSNCSEQTLHFSTARAVVVASGVVRDVLHGYKYRRAVWFEPFLGRLLVQGAGAAVAAAGYDLLVPVPLHPVKRREREFNQAERLARRLSRAMKIPVRTDLVHRQHPTLSQTRLTRMERADNVGRAFVACRNRALSGERVVLVDDVLTTGATASACAGVLLGMGAGEVAVWTVARGI